MPPPPRTVAAIPARDEAERIIACLEALASQQGAQLDHIVLLVNNSTDGTAQVARKLAMPQGIALHVIEHSFPPAEASAGHARRLAMQHAAVLAGADGVIRTTDADGIVDPDWLAQNLAALQRGADAVAGWCELDPHEWSLIPARLHEDDARECAYDALCDEIHARLDPDPADPAPRHTQHSGASIAVTAEAFARCGGVPALPSGEDRALIAALRRVDARIRHAPEVHVTVSGRIVGRSQGGMADTIRRRLTQPDTHLDDRLEPAITCARRALCRGMVRHAWRNPAFDITRLRDHLLLPDATIHAALEAAYFGEAWETLEDFSPLLRRRRVPVADLAEETDIALAILTPLRERSRAGQADRAAPVRESLA